MIRLGDLVAEYLAADERALLDRIASMEADAAVLRELLSVALERLYAVTAQRDRLREQVHRLASENRRLREQLLQDDAA